MPFLRPGIVKIVSELGLAAVTFFWGDPRDHLAVATIDCERANGCKALLASASKKRGSVNLSAGTIVADGTLGKP